MSPGIKVRARPSTIRIVARLPCHCDAGPIQWIRPLRISTEFLGLSRRARPIPKLNLVNQDVQFSHRSPFAGPRTEKADQPDQKITYATSLRTSSKCGTTHGHESGTLKTKN